MKPAAPISAQSVAVGVGIMKVEILDVVTATGIAWVLNDKGQKFEVPYRVQPGKGRIPRKGEIWYIDRSLGPWTFAGYVAKNDAEFTTYTEKTTFSEGVDISLGKQINVGGSTSDASFASVRDGDAQAALSIRKTGDTLDRVYWRTDGVLWVGPGGATAPDVNLYRSAANTWKTDDSLIVGADFTPMGRINKPIAKGYASATVSTISRNGNNKIGLDTVSIDTHSGFDMTNNRYVFPRIGYYRVSYTVMTNTFTNASANATIEAFMDFNGIGGNKYGKVEIPVTDGAAVNMSGTDIIIVTAITDYMELYTRYNSSTVGASYQQVAGALFPTLSIDFLG